MNIQVIKGRLTADPELKHTTSGTAVASFSVAVDRQYAPKGEERQTDFFNVVAWQKTGEFVDKYFKKGQEIIVNGSMQCRNYTDKEGVKRYVWELVANNVYFCGGKADKASADISAPTKSSNIDVSDEFKVIDNDEDLPF